MNFETVFESEFYFRLSKNLQNDFHVRKFILAPLQLGEKTSIGFAMSVDTALLANDSTSPGGRLLTFRKDVVPVEP